MRRRLIALIGLILTTIHPAGALAKGENGVTLALGETVTVRVERGSGVSVLDRGRAGPLSDFDQAALRMALGADPGTASGSNALEIMSGDPRMPDPPAIAHGVVRITFVPVTGGRHSLLIVENGYDRGLAYRARIEVRGRRQPTDVCLVIPERRGHEHWPYPIDRIELSAFQLQPWDESAGPRCR
jgi:hypothetical protein